MLIISIVSFCGLAPNLTAIDNIWKMSESQGYPEITTDNFVSLISIWNYFRMMFAGIASEAFLQRYVTDFLGLS